MTTCNCFVTFKLRCAIDFFAAVQALELAKHLSAQVRARRAASACEAPPTSLGKSSYLDNMFESKADAFSSAAAAGQRAYSADYSTAVNGSTQSSTSEIELKTASSVQAPVSQPLLFSKSAVYDSLSPTSTFRWPRTTAQAFVQSVLQPVDTPPKPLHELLNAPAPPTANLSSSVQPPALGQSHQSLPSTAAMRSAVRQLPHCRGPQRLRLAHSAEQLLRACPAQEQDALITGQVFPVLLQLLRAIPPVSSCLPLEALPLLEDAAGTDCNEEHTSKAAHLGSTARALSFAGEEGGASVGVRGGVSSQQALAAEQWAHEQAQAADAATAEWRVLVVLCSLMGSLSPDALVCLWRPHEQLVCAVGGALLRAGGCRGDDPLPQQAHPAPDMRMYSVPLVPHDVFQCLGQAIGHVGGGALKWLFGACGGGHALPVTAHRILQGVMSVPGTACSAVALASTAILRQDVCAPINGSLSLSGVEARVKAVYTSRSAVIAATTSALAHCGDMDHLVPPSVSKSLGWAVASSLSGLHTGGVEAGASAVDARWTRKMTAQAGMLLGSAGVHAISAKSATSDSDGVREACVSAARRVLLYSSKGELRRALRSSACILVAPDDAAASIASQALGTLVSEAEAPPLQVLVAPPTAADFKHKSTSTTHDSAIQESKHGHASSDCVPVLGGPTPFKVRRPHGGGTRPGAQVPGKVGPAGNTAQTPEATPAPFASPAAPTLAQTAAEAVGGSDVVDGDGGRRQLLSPGATLRQHVPTNGDKGGKNVISDAETSRQAEPWRHACGADGPIGALLATGRVQPSHLERVCMVMKASTAAQVLAEVARAFHEAPQAAGGGRGGTDGAEEEEGPPFPASVGGVLVALAMAQHDPSASVRACALQSVAGLRGDGLACLVQAARLPAAQHYLRSVLHTALEGGRWGGRVLVAATAYKPERDNKCSSRTPFAEGMVEWKAGLRGGQMADNPPTEKSQPPSSNLALQAVASSWAAVHGAPAGSVSHVNDVSGPCGVFFHFCDAMQQAAPLGATKGSTASALDRTRAVVGFDSLHVARGQALRNTLGAALQVGTPEDTSKVQAETVAAHLNAGVAALRAQVPLGVYRGAQLVAEAASAWAAGASNQSAARLGCPGSVLVQLVLKGVLAGTSDAVPTVRHAAWSALGVVPLLVASVTGGRLHAALACGSQDASPSARNAAHAALAAAALAHAAAVPCLQRLCGGGTSSGEGGAHDSSCADVLRPLFVSLQKQWRHLIALAVDQNPFPQTGSQAMTALAGCGSRGVSALLQAAQDSCRNAGDRRIALAALGNIPICPMLLDGLGPILNSTHTQMLLAAREGGVYTFPGAPAAALHALLQQHRQLHNTRQHGQLPPPAYGVTGVLDWLRGAVTPNMSAVANIASSSGLLRVASGALGDRNPNISAAAKRVFCAQSTNTKHQGVLLLLHILRTGHRLSQQVAAADALCSLGAPWLVRSLLSIAANASLEVAVAVCSGLPRLDVRATAEYILQKRSVKHALAVSAQATALLRNSVSMQKQRQLQRAGKAAFTLPAPAQQWLEQLVSALRLSQLCRSSEALQLQQHAPPGDEHEAPSEGTATAEQRAAQLKAEVEAMLARRSAASSSAHGERPHAQGGSPASSEHSDPDRRMVSAANHDAAMSVGSSSIEEALPADGAAIPVGQNTEDPFVRSIMSGSLDTRPNPTAELASHNHWELAGQSELHSPSRNAGGTGFVPTSRALRRENQPAAVTRGTAVKPALVVGEPLSPGD